MTTPVARDIRNATQLLELFEEMCGWDPYADEPDLAGWKKKAIEAGKINRKVATKPDTYSWANLAETVRYCRRNRLEVKAPMGLFFHVDEAILAKRRADKARAASEKDMTYERALEIERSRPDGAAWVAKFTRAAGPARKELLAEWTATRQLS